MTTGIKQSISDQSGNFGFQFNLSISDITKNVNIGFSGVSGLKVNWNLSQGKIYDNNSYYCGSYLANSNIFISGNIGLNTYDYYINDVITALSQNKNSGILNYFYVNSESGNFISFNNSIVGNRPNFNLSTGINFYTGQLASGTLINNSNGNIRIFSGLSSNPNIFYSGNTTGNIPPGGTGYFYNFISGIRVGSITSDSSYILYTNFGDISNGINFNAVEVSSTGHTYFNYAPIGNISGVPQVTGSDLIGISFNTISGFNYINIPFFDAQLIYHSGFTGNFYDSINVSGFYCTFASGFMSGGSGIISGFTSGLAFGTSSITNLNYSGYISGYIFNSVTGSGYVTGIASGELTGIINPFLYNRSFTGAWDFSTGVSNSNLIDFFQSGQFIYNKYYNPAGPLNNFSGNSIFTRVSYTPYLDTGIDVARLLITGLNSGIDIFITGRRT